MVSFNGTGLITANQNSSHLAIQPDEFSCLSVGRTLRKCRTTLVTSVIAVSGTTTPSITAVKVLDQEGIVAAMTIEEVYAK